MATNFAEVKSIAWKVFDERFGIISVIDKGAVGDGVTDDTAAIQTAIDTGETSIIFPSGTYQCSGLTQSTNFQQFIGLGNARLRKNANGVILTSTGGFVECHNLGFTGDAATPVFTGDNVTFSGNNCGMINCFSQQAYARAVKATGGHFQIRGTGKGGVYQTADATAAGYDIELGVSGTATLYHNLIGVYSSQNTGGILSIDTGGISIVGCQFGKLTVDSGTGPAGSGSSAIVGNRILNVVTVELPSTVFTSNIFGSLANITLAAGTSLCSIDSSNQFASGLTITNNGNANNFIEKNVSGGSYPQIRIGDDASNANFTAEPVSGVMGLSKLGVGNSAAATTPGTVTKKIQVFDQTGVSLGYIPVYDAIT